MERRFPYFLEVMQELPPGLKGWEEMYPSWYIPREEMAEYENSRLWYQDKIHGAHPRPPLESTIDEAWGFQFGASANRIYCIPPAQGLHHRYLGTYFYVCGEPPPPPEAVKLKEKEFAERSGYVIEHFREIWDKWLQEFPQIGYALDRIEVPERLPEICPRDVAVPPSYSNPACSVLVRGFSEAVNLMFKAWEYHHWFWQLMYMTVFMFFDSARKLFPGIKEAEALQMLSGVDFQMYQPDKEMARLAKVAISLGVADVLKKEIPAEEKVAELQKTHKGREWLGQFEKVKEPWLCVSCGSGWYHYEGSWIDDLDVPFSYIKGYIERLERGESVERDIEARVKRREELLEGYLKLVPSEEDRAALREAYTRAFRVFRFTEDHLFWVEHWFHTHWFRKMREFGRLLVNHDMLEKPDDIFMFNRFEVPEMLEELGFCWGVDWEVPVRRRYWKEKASRRREILKEAERWTPPPAIGPAPEEVTEIATIALYGVTTETVDKWLSGAEVKPEEVTEIVGIGGSPGVAEGRARVVTSPEQITEVKEGEILVAPSTNPAWAPVFSRIRATVCDIGGVAAHAAIVSREYGIPAVVGAGIATTVIKTGDVIRVDGASGKVTILKRA